MGNKFWYISQYSIRSTEKIFSKQYINISEGKLRQSYSGFFETFYLKLIRKHIGSSKTD